MTYTETDEHGLYAGSWRSLIVDEAFCHPAKFSRDLPGVLVHIGYLEGHDD